MRLSRRMCAGGRPADRGSVGTGPAILFPFSNAENVSSVKPLPDKQTALAMDKAFRLPRRRIAGAIRLGLLNTSVALLPPKPKEFEATIERSFFCVCCTNASEKGLPGTVQPTVAGTKPPC